MNRNESKYFSTAEKMDKAFLQLLEKKDYSYITVKEICAAAGVNRSTFYLHYDNTEDLLTESIEYMNRQFTSYMAEANDKFMHNISDCPIDDLYLITPQYLSPYLNYIKKEKRLFLASLKNSRTLRMHESYEKMFDFVLNPILERYHVPQKSRRYILSFYINGMMAIISEWLQNDCDDSVEDIIALISQCVSRPEK